MSEEWIPVDVQLPPVAPGLSRLSVDVLILQENGVQDIAYCDLQNARWYKSDGSSPVSRRVIGWKIVDIVYNNRRPVESFQRLCYEDSVRHGLMEEYNNMNAELRKKALILRTMQEVAEAYDAAASDDNDHFGEELADIVIMCLVTAADVGIDLAAALQKKRVANMGRKKWHKDE